MSNAVTVSKLPALPTRASLPGYSAAVMDALWHVTSGMPASDEAKAEARLVLAECAAMFGPARAPQVRNWLERLNFGTSQPITPEDFDIRSAVIIDLLADEFHAGCFTAETAREAVRKFKWFPGGQELCEFLAPYARRIRDFEHDMKRVANCTLTPREPRREPTQEEKDAVAAAVAQIVPRGVPQDPVRTVEEQLAALRS